jgi:hypothetical protein
VHALRRRRETQRRGSKRARILYTLAGVRTAFKIAFVGSHGVGKTTLCYGLAARLKARDVSLELVHEVARRCPLPINEQTSLASQSWILHTQIAEELVASAGYPLVVTDRSALDNYEYLLVAAGRQPMLEGLVDAWVRTYDLLVLVPIVDRPSPDGFRATDPVFQKLIADRLSRELAARDLPVLRLDVDARASWLDVVERDVLAMLAPPQLELPVRS